MRNALDEVLCALQKLQRLLPTASVRDGANVELTACLRVFFSRPAPENKKQTNKQTNDIRRSIFLQEWVGPWKALWEPKVGKASGEEKCCRGLKMTNF